MPLAWTSIFALLAFSGFASDAPPEVSTVIIPDELFTPSLEDEGVSLVQSSMLQTTEDELPWCLRTFAVAAGTFSSRDDVLALEDACIEILPERECFIASDLLGQPPFAAHNIAAACRELRGADLRLHRKRLQEVRTLLGKRQGDTSLLVSEATLESSLRRKQNEQAKAGMPPYPNPDCTNLTEKVNNVTQVRNISTPNGTIAKGCWIWEDAYSTTTTTTTTTRTTTPANTSTIASSSTTGNSSSR
uniref:Uncharacterized protein n=1 Tax=Alexandrium monilatum TaxID=311494 RepID=A0A6T1IZF9_9DINO|mmetsp:Transcript_38082/g.118400  ORF Transcript_38082/g.118400 Transcript_38082/m.118400 type:complete len:246 (-) Transcript_38082:46-783(-)